MMTFRFSLSQLSVTTSLFAAPPNMVNMPDAVPRHDPAV